MGTVATSAPGGEEVVSKSFLARFAGVFYAPGETFHDIARKPDFLLPLIALTVLSIASAEIFLAKIGMAVVVRKGIEQSHSASQVKPEQIQQAVPLYTMVTHVVGVVWPTLAVVVVAALGLLFTNAFFGAQVRFKTSLAAASYAYVVKALVGLISIPMFLFGDSENFNVNAPVPTSPAFFLTPPAEYSRALIAAAASLDIFDIWFIVLLGIAYSEATNRKVKPLTLGLCFGGAWLLVVLGKIGLVLLTS
jgi:Yip1-like protein